MAEACIYCGRADAFSREHHIPAGLGDFRDYPFLCERVCTSCNGRLGQLDEELCRRSPEAYFRSLLRIKGRKGHQPFYPFRPSSPTSLGLQLLIEPPGWDVPALCELVSDSPAGTRTRHFTFLPQVVVVDSKGRPFPFLVENIKGPEDLRQQVAELGIDGIKSIYFIAEPGQEERVRGLVSWYEGGLTMLPDIEPGDSFRGSRTVSRFRRHYFRAVAKIAFHYYLATDTEYRGDEALFCGIRHFIYQDGDPGEYVGHNRNPILRHSKQGLTTGDWGHVIHVEKSNEGITVRLQLFLGPGCMPPTYHVKLAKNLSPIIYRHDPWGSLFRYDRTPSPDGHDGQVLPLRCPKRIIVP